MKIRITGSSIKRSPPGSDFSLWGMNGCFCSPGLLLLTLEPAHFVRILLPALALILLIFAALAFLYNRRILNKNKNIEKVLEDNNRQTEKLRKELNRIRNQIARKEQDQPKAERSIEIQWPKTIQNAAGNLTLSGRNGYGQAEKGEALMRVLVVDDNEEILRYIANHLCRKYQVLVSSQPEEGLELLRKELPDLVVTDLVMQGMNGIEFCRQIRTHEQTSHIPVIILTSRSDPEFRAESLRSGADDYLLKPFDVNELGTRVHNLIEQRQSLRKRFSREISIEASDVTVTSMDQQFLEKAINLVEQHISESEYSVEEFQKEMNMSHSTLSRKLNALTNQSPVEFIRIIRLKRAATLLKQGYGNVTQVAYETGFNSPSYFAKWFKDQYGVSPFQYARGEDRVQREE
ncbi:MAG: response regulator [Bacteroidales bacterium]